MNLNSLHILLLLSTHFLTYGIQGGPSSILQAQLARTANVKPWLTEHQRLLYLGLLAPWH
ncbi:hypothetical protein MAR_013142 [Mya arenaria]|uniref:Uncharacterized protein n=1 Tax=Mya arenaria TaxID=6604 RepID=A0ABY7FZ13_MYAAR|nr:hypothetical protein MAR_013142 [Mya arenaria]